MKDPRSIIHHISLIRGVGSATIQKLIGGFGVDDLSNIYNATSFDFRRIGISEKSSAALAAGLLDVSLYERECLDLQKYNLSFLTLIDEKYPDLLKSIHLPPPILYFNGEPVWDNFDFISFVGSRKASNYAKRVISHLVSECVDLGFGVASGGALGADSMAHEKTLEVGGKTIAVLGSGLLSPYPRSNTSLFKSIVDSGGAVVSSFPLNSEALPGNFPARNRIISGMSLGCVVVQAAKRSGALITASFALEQGREVFAVPGLIDDPLSAGCNLLIQKGAKLVLSAEDIASEISGMSVRDYSKRRASSLNEPVRPLVVENCSFTGLEKNILTFCVVPRSVDDISKELKEDIQNIYQTLNSLQMDEKMIQDFAGMWQRL